MSGQIFISYRRQESGWSARSLRDRLCREFNPDQIFMDLDAIALGEDFVDAIETTVARCDVLVAVIGNNWLTSKDESGGRRLDNREDFVRMEIGTALKRKIRVIPVLVDGALMPRADDLPQDLKLLVRRNALSITTISFEGDLQRLAGAIRQVLEKVAAEEREKERLEAEQRETERLEAQQQEKERLEVARKQREEKERLEPEQRQREDQKRLEAEKRQREEQERLAAEKSERKGQEGSESQSVRRLEGTQFAGELIPEPEKVAKKEHEPEKPLDSKKGVLARTLRFPREIKILATLLSATRAGQFLRLFLSVCSPPVLLAFSTGSASLASRSLLSCRRS